MKILEMKTTRSCNFLSPRSPSSLASHRKCDKFAKDSGIYKKSGGLEYWNTAKERRNLHSFDMKSPHRAAIFFFAFHGS